MDQDELIADELIARQIDIFRFTASERAAVLRILKTLEDELVELLFYSGKALSETTRADKAALLRQAQAVIAQYYGQISDEVGANLAGLGEFEAKATAATLAAGFAGAVAPKLPTQGFFANLVRDTLITGSPSADWWKRQAGDMTFRFGNEVRQGIAAAESNAQIIRRVRGAEGVPGLMDLARHNAAALVQTSVQTVAGAARMETFERNDEIIKGYRQLSTLDSHTTPVCVAYSGKEWDLKKAPLGGHGLPFVNLPNGSTTGTPRHWNCRSLITVIPKSFRELGLDVPDFQPSTRAASGGPVASSTTFEQFIDRKGKAFADDLLGPGRAELYRDGKISLTQLLDQHGRPLTLAELRARYE
jgi:hypothetical protein